MAWNGRDESEASGRSDKQGGRDPGLAVNREERWRRRGGRANKRYINKRTSHIYYRKGTMAYRVLMVPGDPLPWFDV